MAHPDGVVNVVDACRFLLVMPKFHRNETIQSFVLGTHFDEVRVCSQISVSIC